MIRAIRYVLGMALGVVGVVAPAWGIFHLIRTPSCGSDGVAVYGAPCPDEMALWILAIVLSACVVLPLAIAIAGSASLGNLLLLGPVFLLAPLCFAIGVVWSLLGPSSDPDTHWVGYLVGGIVGVLVLLIGRGVVATRAKARELLAARAAMPSGPTRDAEMEELAAMLAQVAEAKQRGKA